MLSHARFIQTSCMGLVGEDSKPGVCACLCVITGRVRVCFVHCEGPVVKLVKKEYIVKKIF